MAAGDLTLAIAIKATDMASSVIRGIGASFGPLGAGMATLAIGAVSLGVEATKMAGDFQQSMLSLVAHAGLAKSQFDNVSQSVLAMSTAVGRSPTQLAEALYPILSAFSGIQNQAAKSSIALATLRMSFQTVAGTTVDGTAVANAAVGTFNALGLATNNVSLNTQRMTALFDVMDKTVQLGNMQWDAYKNVVSKLAVAIQGTGISFNESQAALATMTNEGFSAQKASTYLSNTFNTLAIKTDALAKHAKALGISFDEAKYGPMTLAQKIEYLNQITDGNKQKLLALMGNNSTALKTFNALSVGVDSYKSNLDALNHAQGTLAGSFATASQGFNFQMERLKAAGDALMITIGTKFLPLASKVVSAITPIVSAFTAWIGAGGHTNGILKDIGDTLAQVGMLFHSVFSILGSGVADKMKSAFAQAQPIIASVGETIHQVIMRIQAVISTINPAVVANGIRQLGQVFMNLSPGVNLFQALSRHAQDLGKWFQTSVIPALNQAKPGFAELLKGAAALWPVLQTVANVVHNVFQKSFDAMLPVFEKAIPLIIRIAGIIAGGLGKALQFLAPYISQAVQALGQFATEIAQRVAPIVMQWLSQIEGGLNAFMTIWNAVWPSLAPILQGIWDEIVGIVKIAWSLVSGTIKLGLDLFSGNWSQAWTDIEDMFKGVWDGIKQFFLGGWEAIKGTAMAGVNAIKGIFQSLADALVGHSIVPDMITAIVGWFTRLPSMAMAGINNFINMAKSALSNFASAAVQLGANIINGVVNGIRSMFGSVSNAMGGLVNLIGSFLPHSPAKQGELAHLNEYGPNLVKGIATGILGSQSILHGAMAQLTRPVGSSFALSGGGNSGNSFALSGGQIIVVQVQPQKQDIYLDKKKVGEGTMQYAAKQVRIQGVKR